MLGLQNMDSPAGSERPHHHSDRDSTAAMHTHESQAMQWPVYLRPIVRIPCDPMLILFSRATCHGIAWSWMQNAITCEFEDMKSDVE